ncbi:MAG: hypothetical protein Q8N08_00630 [Methanobacteriaceae archaeon]|nr:hypothetical protein [Methanobacteriaceae archaeon]
MRYEQEMAKYSLETSIFISIIVGLIIPFMGIRGFFSVLIVGFVASYLTVPEQTSYKVGAMAGGTLAFLLFLYSFITNPALPYTLPSPMVLGIGVAADSFINLILGLVMSLLIYGAMGAIGGYLAVTFFNPEERSVRKITVPKKRPRRTLKRKQL